MVDMFSSIFRDNRFRPEDVPRFEAKLFYEGDRRRPYLERFFVLLILATIIATAGIIGDSTATVIGAMIVAPLMTPIMATAAGLIMGNMSRALNRLSLVLLGVLTVIFLSWLFGVLSPSYLSFSANSQILGRVSPRLIDLIAALASGAAGAFALSREDVADSLPGVAIAISLVPPLCVMGLSLSAGEIDAATGAMLLFMTNFLAIILAGGAVLGILGLNAAARIEVRGTARRKAFALVIVAHRPGSHSARDHRPAGNARRIHRIPDATDSPGMGRGKRVPGTSGASRWRHRYHCRHREWRAAAF
jgi:uncharacterized hydrophobic protein (TIGR00271 family)